MMVQNNKTVKILIVDDDESIRLGYTQLFKKRGYDVRVASDGALGLQAYENEPVDLVITDILMPGEDGLALIKQLKGYDPDVKIIAISGGGDAHNLGFLDMAESFGALIALEKPVSNQDLLHVVGELLN